MQHSKMTLETALTSAVTTAYTIDEYIFEACSRYRIIRSEAATASAPCKLLPDIVIRASNSTHTQLVTSEVDAPIVSI